MSLFISMGDAWTADYLKITGELDVDLRSNIAAEDSDQKGIFTQALKGRTECFHVRNLPGHQKLESIPRSTNSSKRIKDAEWRKFVVDGDSPVDRS